MADQTVEPDRVRVGDNSMDTLYGRHSDRTASDAEIEELRARYGGGVQSGGQPPAKPESAIGGKELKPEAATGVGFVKPEPDAMPNNAPKAPDGAKFDKENGRPAGWLPDPADVSRVSQENIKSIQSELARKDLDAKQRSVLEKELAAERAKDPNDFTDRYNTKLTPEEEAAFQKTPGAKDTYDYDMRGAFKEGAGQADNGHYPDKFKKPNHPTFSDQSMYHGVDGNRGGHWTQNADGKWTFKASDTNVKVHGQEGLQRYFAKRESGNTLELPTPVTAAGVAKDIGQGVVETPRAIASGASKAAQETVNLLFDSTKQFGDWMEEKFPLIDYTPDWMKDPHSVVPTVKSPDSTTGKLVEGVSQFLVGFLGAGKLRGLRSIQPATKFGKIAKAAGQGAIADFSAFDPHQERLSNLVQQFPALSNPVTEYLEAKPEDSAAEGRFKNALEGLGLGQVTEGFLLSVKALRAARIAARASADVAAPAVEVTAKTQPLSQLGDLKGDLFQAYDEAGNKLDTAGKEVNDITPGMVLGREEPKMGQPGEVTGPGASEPKVGNPDNVGGKQEPTLGKPGEVVGPGAQEPQVGANPDNVGGKQEPRATETQQAAQPQPPKYIDINFARMNTPEDIQDVIRRMVDMTASDVENARRGVRTWEATKMSADQVDAWKTLMERRVGEPLNAEQSLAARRLWATSAERLHEVATQAASAPTAENLVAFRKMLATHHAITKEVIGARTETARALNAWAITAEGGGSLTKQIDNLLENSGGAETALELAQRVAKLSNAGMAQELEKMVEGGVFAKSRNAVKQVWINALLTNPATHVGNFVSNSMVAFQSIYERKAAEAISQLTGESGVVDGEAFAMMHGMTVGFRDALRLSAKNLKLGAFPDVSLPAGLERNKVEGTQVGALSSSAWDIGADTTMGKALDYLDVATRAPATALGFSDNIWKMVGYRMELHSLAVRQATQEMNAGQIAQEGFNDRVASIIANPPEQVKLDAVDAALYRTFNQKPADMANRLASAWQNIPVIGALTLPFKNTPINIATYGFERTPLAPLVKQWREDISAGGARGQLAQAKFATGSMIMLATIDLAMQGMITGAGPQKPAEKAEFLRSGKTPYSIKVGDSWVQYNRLDPAASILGMAADFKEMALNGTKQEDLEKYLTGAALSMANAITNKTYMRGIADLFEALGDKERYGEGYFKKIFGSAVPTGVAAVARFEDPYLRATHDMGDAIRARTPGLSQDLPPVRDLWGRPVSFKSEIGSWYDLISPAHVRRENPEPIDKELERLQKYPGSVEKKFQVEGVPLDLTDRPDIYSRYVELAGNEWKHPAWGLGAKDFLNQVVSGQSPLSTVYNLRSDGPTGGKAQYIEALIGQFRSGARRQLMQEFPELQLKVDTEKRPGRGRLAPEVVGQ